MSVDRLRRVDEVLDAALTRAPGEWSALLDAQCSGDPELRKEVEALLARLDTARRLLDSPPANLAAAVLREEREGRADAGEPYEGRRVGAYRLVREIGRGGMSRVFLADRADGQFQQRVAVKLLRPGLDSEIDLERFRAERQILASLSHPNIARLLDGGVTEDGRPYLAMEYVEGSAIDAYCTSHRLGLRDRIQLFIRVVEATQFAHRNLVVHRDLKPSNILVTEDGVVKLLDFGLAKLLERDASPMAPPTTRTGHRWMTPEYAAPEQVRGQTATTVTDVYQLGVVLYELLSGRLPFAVESRSMHDLETAILDQDPAAPSIVAQSKALRGDLDAIVLMALRKEPDRRYASATALAEDLQRYLDGRPVLARTDARGYRLRKFVRRHRAGVAAGSLVAVALIGATGIALSQMREAQRQRDVAVQEGRRQLAMSEIQSVLAGDSRGADGRSLSVVERIELAKQVLLRQFQSEPAVAAEVITDLANRLYDIGERAAQRQLLADAQRVAREADLPAQLALVNCSRAYSFAYDDQFDSARTELAEAQAALRRADERPAEVEGVCVNAEGQLLAAMGQPDAAIPLLTRAVELNGQSGTGRLSRLNDLANGLRQVGRIREASTYQQQIVSALDSAGYGGTEIMQDAMSHLASTTWELGELAVMDSILEVFVRRQDAERGPGHGDGILGFLYGAGKLRLGELDSADVWMGRGMRDTTSAAATIATWTPAALGQLRLDQGRPADARPFIDRLPSGTFLRRMTSALLGARLRYAEGPRADAMTRLERDLRTLGGDGPKVPASLAVPYATAAEWRLADGKARMADSLARIAIAAGGVDTAALRRSAYVGRAELVRARALLALGDTSRAREAAERAVAATTNGFGPMNPYTLTARALADSLARP